MIIANILLFLFTITTLLLCVVTGKTTAICILGLFFLLTFRKPNVAASLLLLIIPFFGNGPGRPLVYLFDGLMAILLLQCFISRRHRIALEAHPPFVISWGILWVGTGFIQILPMLRDLLEITTWQSLSTVITEILTQGETAHLYPIQYILHRTWSFVLVLFFLNQRNGNSLIEKGYYLFIGVLLTISIGLTSYFQLIPISFGFPQHMFGDRLRLQSFFGNPGWLAEYLCLVLPLLLYFSVHREVPQLRRRAVSLLTGASIITLYLTYTRAGMLIGAVTILSFIMMHSVNRLSKTMGGRKAFALIVCIFLVLSVTACLVFPQTIHHLTTTFFNKEKSFGTYFSRLNLWKAAIAIFQSHPLVGSAPGTYYYQSEAYLEKANYLNQVIHNTAHNTFFHLLAEEGAVGLILFLVLLVVSLQRMIAIYRCQRISGNTFFLYAQMWGVIVLYSLVQHLFYVHVIEVMVMLGLATPWFLHKPTTKTRQIPLIGKKLNVIKWSTVLVCLGLTTLFVIQRSNITPLSYGFHKWSGWGGDQLASFRWTKQQACWLFPRIDKAVKAVAIPIAAYQPNIRQKPVTLTVSTTNSSFTLTLTSSNPDFIIIPLPKAQKREIVRLSCDHTWTPAALGGSQDRRQLGIATGKVSFLSPRDLMHNKHITPSGARVVRTGISLQKDEPVILHEREIISFAGYAGIRYLWVEIENKGEEIFMKVTNPSGISHSKRIPSGISRLPLRIPPSRKGVKISLSFTESDIDTSNHPYYTSKQPLFSLKPLELSTYALRHVSHFVVTMRDEFRP